MKYFLTITSLLFGIASHYAQISNSQNPAQFLSNENHSGVFISEPVSSAPGIKFYFGTKGAVRSTPAVFNGKIYFGSADGFLYCIDEKTGSEIWKYDSGNSVNSSPSVANGNIFFTDNGNNLICLGGDKGNLNWKINLGKEIDYKWGFDYYTSSPAIYNGNIYNGSGDGNLYIIDEPSGKIKWTYYCGSKIRTTPLLNKNIVYFGDVAGNFYALDINSKKLKWKYETAGSKIKIEDFGFDRAAIISSPSIYENNILFGSREGCLYCLDIESGKLNWKYEEKMSWVISTPSIYNKNVISGTSDGHFVNSINIKSGKEIWRFSIRQPVWSSVAVTGNVLYFGDYSGSIFALNADTGAELWEIKTGDRIHSSPVVHNGVLFIGSDDGYLYAIAGSAVSDNRSSLSKKAVFWDEPKGYNYFQNNSDVIIRDYFVRENYELLNSKKLESFFTERINDKIPSVVVFADNYFPPGVANDSADTDLLRKYLSSGGKIVLLGFNPLAYIRDTETGQVKGVDFNIASKYFGIDFGGQLTDALKGLYTSFVTEAGVKAGLKGFWISMGGINPDQVSEVFAKDEKGLATTWLKNYGGREGSGLMQLWVNQQLPSDLYMIKNAVEYGLQ